MFCSADEALKLAAQERGKEEQSPVSEDGLSETGKGSSPRADVAITEEEKTLIYQRLNYAQNIRRSVVGELLLSSLYRWTVLHVF